MTKISVYAFLLFSYITLVCCQFPQLKIEQNKAVFCPGEITRLVCKWENEQLPVWEVNGTLTTTAELNRMAGHTISTSLTGGFTRVSITQSQPSVTSYTCVVFLNEDFPSEVVYVTFRGTHLEFVIFVCVVKNVSFFQIHR